MAYGHEQLIGSYAIEEESPSTATISSLGVLGAGQSLTIPLVQPPQSLEGVFGGSIS